MHGDEGSERIADDEIVYRRVPANVDFYVPASDRPVQWITFKPNPNDLFGISVWRAKFVSVEEAVNAGGHGGKEYYLIRLKVADLRRLGAELVATPEEGGHGHAAITTLSRDRYQGPDKNLVRELADRIARELCHSVLGPFRVPAPEQNLPDVE